MFDVSEKAAFVSEGHLFPSQRIGHQPWASAHGFNGIRIFSRIEPISSSAPLCKRGGNAFPGKARMNNEKLLVRRVLAGESAAGDRWIDLYYQDIYRLLRSLTRKRRGGEGSRSVRVSRRLARLAGLSLRLHAPHLAAPHRLQRISALAEIASARRRSGTNRGRNRPERASFRRQSRLGVGIAPLAFGSAGDFPPVLSAGAVREGDRRGHGGSAGNGEVAPFGGSRQIARLDG